MVIVPGWDKRLVKSSMNPDMCELAPVLNSHGIHVCGRDKVGILTDKAVAETRSHVTGLVLDNNMGRGLTVVCCPRATCCRAVNVDGDTSSLLESIVTTLALFLSLELDSDNLDSFLSRLSLRCL